jgi:hypothetical protein
VPAVFIHDPLLSVEGVAEALLLHRQSDASDNTQIWLFQDLDARHGAFAATKYREILKGRKELLGNHLELTSQVSL